MSEPRMTTRAELERERDAIADAIRAILDAPSEAVECLGALTRPVLDFRRIVRDTLDQIEREREKE